VRHIHATWETALAWSGTNQNAIFGLATFLNDMGESALAETKLREFLILSPHHVVGLQFLAIIQAKSGRLSEAAEILQHAVQLEPDADALTETLKEVRRAIEKKAATNPAQGGRP
jgi:cytochrome c-type biogenesis protein CcmH/NrfG